MSSFERLFNPRSIALIGASRDETKLGGMILKNLLRFGGKVYPVNPKYRELMGLKAYSSARDIPGEVDFAIIMRPAPEVPAILRELEGKTRCAVVMSSGFAEIGEAELQDEVKKVSAEEGIRVLGPNCMGIYNPYRRLDTFFLPHERLKRPGKGNVGIISQSGAILSCLLSAARASRTGVSKVVGYGNALDIDESELYDYLADDADTGVVVSYIESVGDGRRFLEKARMLSEKKPLIILKSGKGESGQTAAFSHTGRLAGRYEVFHSLLRRYGIREALDFDSLMDATKALSYQKTGSGSRVCIVTNGGGSGVLAADECMRQGLEVPALSQQAREKLGRIFPHFYGINNPVDLTAQVSDADYATALCELRDDYDGFLIIALPNVMGITEGLAEKLKTAKSSLNKPLVGYISEGSISGRLTGLIEKARIPVYSSPERAVRALKALLE
ncbi:MAG: CoA-binding protein [Nitrospiraceae bacterium]|jgi:acyl-CoA synthetase (NDP forming)|nr:MAG: CoA-binding protein [Nitrospiraceae bacterium]